jgi:hypothetical protein
VTVLAATLPEHSNDGYVAAAYIVFFAIVLIYVAIMAVRLGRVERKVRTLEGTLHEGSPPTSGGKQAGELSVQEREKQREIV